MGILLGKLHDENEILFSFAIPHPSRSRLIANSAFASDSASILPREEGGLRGLSRLEPDLFVTVIVLSSLGDMHDDDQASE